MLSLTSLADALLQSSQDPRLDFTEPHGEPALAAPDSISWQVFKNPVALFVGGVAAVILELAEPAVRTGVWTQSTFTQDPVGRLRRTGRAAMVTVYGARSVALPMIAGVVRMHARVAGRTPSGEAFSASDPALLDWVQATASFGFGAAYDRYVSRLSTDELDRLYAESAPAARLYGATHAPRSSREMQAIFESKRSRLEPSTIIHEFLRIMRTAPILPTPARPAQGVLVRAAVDLIPSWIRERLGLRPAMGLRALQRPIVKLAGAVTDRLVLPDGPPASACRRLGLPDGYLYRRENRHAPPPSTPSP